MTHTVWKQLGFTCKDSPYISDSLQPTLEEFFTIFVILFKNIQRLECKIHILRIHVRDKKTLFMEEKLWNAGQKSQCISWPEYYQLLDELKELESTLPDAKEQPAGVVSSVLGKWLTTEDGAAALHAAGGNQRT